MFSKDINYQHMLLVRPSFQKKMDKLFSQSCLCACSHDFTNIPLHLPHDEFYILMFDFKYKEMLAAGQSLIPIDGM